MAGAVTASYKQMDIIICDHNAAVSGVTRLAAERRYIRRYIRKYRKGYRGSGVEVGFSLIDIDNNNGNNKNNAWYRYIYCILATPAGDI
jgi:hypothetical protein